MSEPKWTPGPWMRMHHGGITQAVKDGEPFRRIPHSSCWADHAWSQDDATDESIANDRLIAAAPELYEALEEAAEALDNYSGVLDWMDGEPRPNDAMKALTVVNAALRKARGE